MTQRHEQPVVGGLLSVDNADSVRLPMYAFCADGYAQNVRLCVIDTRRKVWRVRRIIPI
jgi:hypothetical protein